MESSKLEDKILAEIDLIQIEIKELRNFKLDMLENNIDDEKLLIEISKDIRLLEGKIEGLEIALNFIE